MAKPLVKRKFLQRGDFVSRGNVCGVGTAEVPTALREIVAKDYRK